ncbi:MAG: MGDG synthase family glycosyltransferase, partial [Bacillota bacterium]
IDSKSIETDLDTKNIAINYFFKEETKLRNLYDKFTELRKERKMDKTGPQKVSYNRKSPVHRRVHNVFLRYSPDIVIAMTPRVLAPSLAVKEKIKSKAKVVVVIDEFCLNRQLVNKNVDFYFVDNHDIKEELEKLNIDEDKIRVTNIPVRKTFSKELTREEALKEFDFEDKPTIMIVASQYGEEKFKRVINAIYQAKLDINVLVACGYSRRLLSYVREKTDFLGLNEGIDMNAGYCAADIVVARPTATVLAEALYKKKLVFSIYPVGEMERRTHDYLGLDLIAKMDDEDMVVEKIKEYLENKDNFEAMRRLVDNAVDGEPVEKIASKLYEMMI